MSAFASPLASAPGKLMVLGEYAILEGGPALMLAVDRRVSAYEVSGKAEPAGPFLARAAELCDEIADGPTIRVDSSALRSGGRKLGLGSSAAVTVAYIAARLAAAGEPFSRATIHRLAHRAHGDVSAKGGGRGSGADVAASTFGGITEVLPTVGGTPVVRALAAADLVWVAVDSGASANTRTLVGAVDRFAQRNPRDHKLSIDELAASARSGIEALEARSFDGLRESFERGFAALTRLGRGADLELVTELHHKIAQTARNHGGAAKSTGAGGGDSALAIFADMSAAGQFCVDLEASGIEPLALNVEPTGVTVFPSTHTTR